MIAPLRIRLFQLLNRPEVILFHGFEPVIRRASRPMRQPRGVWHVIDKDFSE